MKPNVEAHACNPSIPRVEAVRAQAQGLRPVWVAGDPASIKQHNKEISHFLYRLKEKRSLRSHYEIVCELGEY